MLLRKGFFVFFLLFYLLILCLIFKNDVFDFVLRKTKLANFPYHSSLNSKSDGKVSFFFVFLYLDFFENPTSCELTKNLQLISLTNHLSLYRDGNAGEGA